MKKFYITSLFILSSIYSFSQCFVVATALNVTCAGACDGMVMANVTGGSPPYTYIWSPGGCTSPSCAGLCAGTYTVVVFDSGGISCSAVATVGSPPALMVGTSSTPASCSTCADGTATATATGGTPGYVYTWSPGGCTNATCTGLLPGGYSVCVTDANGCVTCDSVSVAFTTGVSETAKTDIISIYPNPASSFVSIDIELGAISSTEISVTNILGEQLFIEKLAETKTVKKTIPVNNLANGIYFITVKTKQGKSVQKFVKR